MDFFIYGMLTVPTIAASSGTETGRVKIVKTAILLIGAAGEQVNLIQDVLCAEGYEVQRKEGSELNQSVDNSLSHFNLIILLDQDEGRRFEIKRRRQG